MNLGTIRVLAGLVTAALAGVIAVGLTGVDRDPVRSAEDLQPRRVRVVAIVDGDTLRVETMEGRSLGRIRVLGIDAPETEHPPDPTECYGDTATALLERLVPIGVIVELVADAHQDDRDHYDRLLRYVDHRGQDVAARLIQAGAVRLYQDADRLVRGATYRAAARTAQEADRGLWGDC
ncbi:MAG: thermonuclease family protein [Brachybacterium sp.]|nr:thermonuclease family protein [Brachybacterium sp.]